MGNFCLVCFLYCGSIWMSENYDGHLSLSSWDIFWWWHFLFTFTLTLHTQRWGQYNGKMFPHVPVTEEMWAGYKWMCTLIWMMYSAGYEMYSLENFYSEPVFNTSVVWIVFHTILVNVSQNIRYLGSYLLEVLSSL